LRGSNAELGFPADLYLEGSDQHRGWFHSSLLIACMTDGVPPYKALLTHGFVIDLEGRKMSKSKGNTMAPKEIADTLGAEILRLWVASGDFSGELTISSEILKRVVEAYRRIRNTLRFLLANTSDFDAAKHAVPVAQMTEIDRYALALMGREQQAMTDDYARFQFHLVAQKLQSFCSEDLGAFYLDILKDRLYTCGAESVPRRSAQTALWHITHALARLMAPILSFTAEEVWRVFSRTQDDSVFFHTWHPVPEIADAASLLGKWDRLRLLRDPVRKQIEQLRVENKVGSSLQAEVEIRADGEDYEVLASLGDDLKYLLLTSAARVTRSNDPGALATPSSLPKCERCWHYREEVGANAEHPGLCGRCISNLFGTGEPRPHA
jgi:isoleucyl-tRNA synthetase